MQLKKMIERAELKMQNQDFTAYHDSVSNEIALTPLCGMPPQQL